MGEVKREVEEEEQGGKRAVVIYIGDLKWVVADETRAIVLVVEVLGRLVSEYSRVSLVGSTDYRTYVRCQAHKLSLWSLSGLRFLSLLPTSDFGPFSSPYFRFQFLFPEATDPRSSLCSLRQSKPRPEMAGKLHSVQRENKPLPTSSNGGICSYNLHKFTPHEEEDEATMNVTLSLCTHSPQSPPPRGIKEAGRLRELMVENMPWQVALIPTILKALVRPKQRKDTCLLLDGDDPTGKRRLPLVIAEAFSTSITRLDIRRPHRFPEPSSGVVVLENMDLADPASAKYLTEALNNGGGGGGRKIFLVTEGGGGREEDFVVRIRAETGKRRRGCREGIDLNTKAAGEGGDGPGSSDPPDVFASLERVVFERKTGAEEWVREEVSTELRAAAVEVDRSLLEEMVAGGGSFTRGTLERWVKEVLEPSLDGSVRVTGLRICYDGRYTGPGRGFMGSCLPMVIHGSMG